MKNAINNGEILFSAAEVANCTGLDQLQVRALEPAGFGSPGHWRMVGNAVVYTERGMALLEEALMAADRGVEAVRLHALLVETKQAHETPSRSLIEAGPKSGREPYYRKGDLA